jgi:uncharacterized membrane protein
MIPRFHLWWMIAAIISIAALSAAFYPRLPDPCPIHWNIHGQVDNYASRLTAALFGPALAAGITLLLLVLPVIGPFRRNMESFRGVYGRICALILTFFVAIHVVTLLAATGKPLRMGAILTVLIGVMFACLGNWMGKIRRNFYVGIRTPWTLANEVVWEKTHRLGSKLFVAAGITSAVTGLFASEVSCFVVLMTALFASVTSSVIYSFVVYRRLGQVDDLVTGSRAESLKGIS